MEFRALLLSTCYCVIGTHQVILALSESLSAHDTLRNLSNSYWTWKLQQFPKFATDMGNHNYDETVEEFTLGAFQRRKDTCQDFLTQLDAIDPQALTSTERQNMAVLRADLAYFVDGYRWHLYGPLNPMNFLEGHHRMPSWLGKKYETEEAFASLMKRMEAQVAQINQLIELMKIAINLKRTNHALSMEGVVDEVTSFLSRPANNSAYYIPFKKLTPENIPEEAMQGIRERGLDYITNNVHPVMAKLKDFLETEYLPNTRPHIGVGSFEDGQDYYQACLRFHLSSNMTAAQVRDIGLSEVKRIKGLMEGVMRREGFDGTLSEFISYLRDERYHDFYGLNDSGILRYYKNIVNSIEPKLQTVFRNIPDSKLSVQPMQRDGPSGSYSYGTFWVNLHRPEERPTFTMMALALHEASPGHHLQTIFARELTLPDFRKHGAWSTKYYAVPFNFPWYTAYTEGWSLYSEYLGEEMGCYNESALELFGRYSSEIFRACRLVVDTGIHAFNMSLEEAMQYMADHTVIPEEQIRTEIHRYITWPGQACAYKIGELDILRMRRRAEEMLGEKFDVAEFNEQVLNTSRVPMYVLDNVISMWIDQKMVLALAASTASNPFCCSSGGVAMQIVFLIVFSRFGF